LRKIKKGGKLMKIKTNVLNYKDPDTGEYVAVPVVVSGNDENVTAENIVEALGYTPANEEVVEELNEKLVQLDVKVETISEKVISDDYEWTIPRFELVEGKLVALSSNLKSFWLYDNADGRYIKLEKGNITKIRANGYQWDVNFRFFGVIFTDATNNVVEYHELSANNTTFSAELEVPDSVEYIYINGNMDVGDLSVVAYMPKGAVSKKLIGVGVAVYVAAAILFKAMTKNDFRALRRRRKA
jgi:hypothetical protein